MAEARYRSREWFRQRIKTLDQAHCTTAAQLQAVLTQQVELGRQMAMADLKRELFDCLARLIERTPIDTGRARVAWQVVMELIESAPSEDPASIAEYAARQALIAMELDEAETIYVLNNVEYILALDAGWSKSSPGGFIGLFLHELKTQLEAAARGF